VFIAVRKPFRIHRSPEFAPPIGDITSVGNPEMNARNLSVGKVHLMSYHAPDPFGHSADISGFVPQQVASASRQAHKLTPRAVLNPIGVVVPKDNQRRYED
jgi:hypothetical protein